MSTCGCSLRNAACATDYFEQRRGCITNLFRVFTNLLELLKRCFRLLDTDCFLLGFCSFDTSKNKRSKNITMSTVGWCYMSQSAVWRWSSCSEVRAQIHHPNMLAGSTSRKRSNLKGRTGTMKIKKSDPNAAKLFFCWQQRERRYKPTDARLREEELPPGAKGDW